MEELPSTTLLDGEITGIRFSLANHQDICTASISDCPISHASQLGNPFLGLPLEYGKCESCGTSEPGKCEGHFGYIELPIPIYHPSHVIELKKLLSLLCLKCLRIKKTQSKSNGVTERLLSSCCEEASQISIKEIKKQDTGACYLQLKLPSRSTIRSGLWNFLEKYGYRYGEGVTRNLLAYEAMEMLKKIPEETRRKLAGKGYFPQDGYILHYLPVPPNCLSVPEISDGVTIMSADQSITMLKKVLRQVEIIKSSRSGSPTFEAHEAEANDLQCAVEQYLQARGVTKKSQSKDTRFGINNKESANSSTKAWLEKMRTLFIKKGSGFSSRSVITGDSYKGVNEIGLPFEIAQRITFEEKVNTHNMAYLQDLVDKKLCLTYRDGASTYSLSEGSKGHTFLRPGQVVHRRIMDGDIVFINRPPTTHKHALQALSVYIHEDHTVKINPLICGPLSADFDGDCVHLFYPQSLAAKAEVYELFSVEKQLLSSHSGNLNLQLGADSLLSLKMMFNKFYLNKPDTQQLVMFSTNSSLPQPALFKSHNSGPHWTAQQILQTALPESFDCHGENYLIVKSLILEFDMNRDVVLSLTNNILTSLFSEKGPKEVLKFLNTLQPLLMENLYAEGFSIGLEDFSFPLKTIQNIQKNLQDLSPLLYHLRSVYDEVLEKRLENELYVVKAPASDFILQSPVLGYLIDSKSDSAINKVVQQIGFVGLQLSDQGKFYTRTLVDDMASLFRGKYPFRDEYPSGEHGLIKSCFFHGLDPYEEMVHSISSREVIVRSTRGLTEPGTLFKNLMAILRDVVVCYDGTVRNVSSNSIVQFEYGARKKNKSQNLFPAGEPVGVLAATAMSTPAYKAVLDSSPSSNSSWELMKEVLLCRVNFKNDASDRRVILYLNECNCGRKFCREHAAYVVENQLKKVSLKDAATEFTIEYKRQGLVTEGSEIDAGLTGHVHLNKSILDKYNITMQDVYVKCQDAINLLKKKKKIGLLFKRIILSVSECCYFQQRPCGSNCEEMPCLTFYWQDANDIRLERTSHILADVICPVLLQTIIKGDPRISSVNIVWASPGTTTWIRNPCKTWKGELVLDIVLEKSAVKQSGDAWRVVLDSCLPVLHLIDANRSIPYGVKQVQELLGISCAFDQAVQRLSTSVAMVTKGVLREHLILLANTMTCAGNMVGFNIGGYKALSRSLNIQVPFTEATLYTPRKCFERAAEKCHTDALSSIVASCSWGRHVTVGTGSRFELLWDTKEVGHKQTASTDVYNLLHMVRKIPNGGVSDTGCLGADLDDIGLDDENDDLAMSPEQSGEFAKAVFEDGMDFENNSEFPVSNNNEANESTWDKVASGHADSNGGGGWNVEPSSTSSKPSGGWGGWGGDSKAYDEMPSREPESDWSKKGITTSELSNGWDKKLEGSGTTVTAAGWGNNSDVQKKTTSFEPSDDWTKKVEQGSKQESDGWASSKTGGWDASNENSQPAKSDAWGAPSAVGGNENGKRSSFNKNNSENWAKKPEIVANQPSTGGWGNTSVQKGGSENDTSSAWGQKTESSFKKNNSWGKKVEEASQVESWSNQQSTAGWGDKDVSKGTGDRDPASDWSKKVEGAGKSETEQGWGAPKSGGWGSSSQPVNSQSWGSEKVAPADPILSWSNKSEGAGKAEQALDAPKTGGWGASSQPVNSQAWGSEKAENTSSSDWSKKSEGGAGKAETEQGWASQKAEGGWGASNEVSQTDNSQWGSPSPRGNDNGTASQWGTPSASNFNKNRSDNNNSRGWGPGGADWKIKKNIPPRSPGIFNDDSNPGGFTPFRPRFDRFTPDEQPIHSEVEPMMQSIRRIMHQSGYNDGDKLSAEDQVYILDNVFAHHPDKAVKMGSGVDFVMINKHSKFQDTRCFYIVDTNGREEDFSSRKCVENYALGKYPSEHAESFIKKFFRPKTPREQSQPPPDASQTPDQNQNPEETEKQTQIVEESGTENTQ